MALIIKVMFLALLLGQFSSSSSYETNPYLTVKLEGKLPIIISAPHGGRQRPDTFPDRQHGCYDSTSDTCIYTHTCTQPRSKAKCGVNTVGDYMTDKVAKIVYDKITELLGESPKLVVSKLSRKKLDPNREEDEATLGDPEAIKVYTDYHNALKDASDSIHGPGLLIDIHGHGKPKTWQMLGYLVSGYKLNNYPCDQLNAYANHSSIRSLASQSNSSFVDLLRAGPESFGAMLEAKGFPAVPSPNNHGPGSASFFSGGYITKVYGSRDGGLVDAIQVETFRGNRTPKENRIAYSKALAQVIVQYYELHYRD